MATKRAPPAPLASVETKLNVWLNIASVVIAVVVPLFTVVFGGMYWAGSFTATIKGQLDSQAKEIDLKLLPLSAKVDAVSGKIESSGKDAQAKTDILSQKVDSANALALAKQDALSSRVDSNIIEQQTFRTSVQNWLTKLAESQQGLSNQINQERVDRLTESAKKK